MEIKCTAHEKRAWFQAFLGGHVCPFEEYCLAGVSCEECMQARVKWVITDPENDVED